MNFRQKRSSIDDPEISLISLVDVVFLLLIFFMVTTTFSKDSAIKIDLPDTATATELLDDDNRIIVQVDESGLYSIKSRNDGRYRKLVNSSTQTLRRAIAHAGEGITNPLVVIRADKLVAYDAVIKAMDATRQTGFNQITLSVENIK